MVSRSLLTVAGLAIVGLVGGCCTCDQCATPSSTSEVVYTDASYVQSAPSDCGCGCSGASASNYVSSPQPTVAGSGSTNVSSEMSSASVSPYQSQAVTETSASPTIIEPPVDNATPGFIVGSSTKSIGNALPGNLLPGNQ